MIRAHPRLAWIAAGLFALAALICVPLVIEAETLMAAADDPVAITDRALDRTFDEHAAHDQIEAALAASDADLAKSFLDLANDRGIAVPPDLAARVNTAVDDANSARAVAGSFASGLITGEPTDMAGLAGTAVGDLFVFGDIRDAIREGSRYVSGEHYDQLVLGLACLGIAVTAGTYASFGSAAPARVGLSVAKAASKTGRIGARMADFIGRSLRRVVDFGALKRAGSSLIEPAVAVRTAREAVKVEKADGLVRLVSDVGTVQAKAGTQAALDGLKVAEGPRDMGRIAKLAEKKGGKTRAILRFLGRSAILLSLGTFDLAMWVLWAIMTVFGFVASTKAGVERMTFRYLQRKKARRLERQLELAQARALSPRSV